mmetsp:Transcript_33826/g.64404  ORF Transcript_33826/g.64404 Transcript_33826/m.64404 type:complete len:227 (-) Transcript_33826:1896-2576(-)|eukprot:CAMPEP_0201605708 /NCGR_PEP_ID=MMETSP0492-20130828/5433_1 /ASSEMBLY_ACC=CAM_ASM_000837 /TAXON_ID=420259 /ORGANISM="Thalassiosira gravida, Strain GMp14c1" /LENGTH=226 /DNA_ID=CAMNT_0048070005 /DNA_START=260 /DNA_END=940 /DNA_ORIENTATION=+
MSESSVANKIPESNLVFVGIPLPEERAVSAFIHSSESESNHSITSCGGFDGLFAFIVGVILAGFAWIANQGWTVASFLLFGQFSWTFASSWKHLALCLIGSVCTSIAFWAVFKMIFPEAEEDEDSSDPPSYKKDVADALQDLGELGFVVGYFCSQAFLTNLMYNPLTEVGIKYELSNDLSAATLIIMIVWMFSTKMRDYMRAVKRVECNHNVDYADEAAYTRLEVV